METIKLIITNKALIIPIIVLLCTQGVKVIYFSIKEKKINLYKMLTTGGLPSSHSALVSSLATMMAILKGFDSLEFAICSIVALIVMYDATGVRRAAGEHARILNKILDENPQIQDEKRGKKLVELLGHTKIEVYAGMVTGIILTLLLYF